MSENKVPEWAESLPDDLKSIPVIQNTPDITTLAKRLVDLDRYRGSSIALPKDGDDESFKRFTDAVSKRGFIPGEVPTSPDDYPVPDIDLESAGVSDDWLASQKTLYHQMGLTKQQAEKAIKAEVGRMSDKRTKLMERYGEDKLKIIEDTSVKLGLDKGEDAFFEYLLKQGTQMNTEDSTHAAGGIPASSESLVDMEAKLMDISEQLAKMPDYDPRSKALESQHRQLVLKIGAVRTGDPSLAKMSWEEAAARAFNARK